LPATDTTLADVDAPAQKPSHFFAIFIRASREQIWEATFMQIAGGMPFILSGLKTLLETGEPLTG
jgi:hypothetical protein